MPKYFFIYCLSFIGICNISNAQYGRTYQEIGIMAGPVFFQSDFGSRDTFENYYKNNGFSIGAFYYLSLKGNNNSLTENFKLRLEASYMTANLKHYGKYVVNNNLLSRQLQAMKGSVETINAGFQIEYYPFKTDDYNRTLIFSPYISAGSQVSNYTSSVYSVLGDLGEPTITPPKYINSFRNESGIAASLTTSIGTRYLLADYSALVLDLRTQFYFSDWVDGLNPDSKLYPENKSNDWSTTINFGYIYYFN